MSRLVIPGRRRAFVANASWAKWDQLSQAGLATAKIWCALHDGPLNTDNDTGAGVGLTGADLVLTQNGSPAVTAGPPPYRLCVDGTDYFTATAVWANATIACGGPWFMAWKFNNLDHPIANNARIVDITGAADTWVLYMDTNHKLVLDITKDGSNTNQLTSGSIGSGDVYVYTGYDGAAALAGFSSERLITWESLPAAQKLAINGNYAYSPGDFGTQRLFYTNSGGSQCLNNTKVYWAVAAAQFLM